MGIHYFLKGPPLPSDAPGIQGFWERQYVKLCVKSSTSTLGTRSVVLLCLGICSLVKGRTDVGGRILSCAGTLC